MRIFRVLAAAALLLAAVSGAAAQETMRLYVEEGTISGAEADRLLGILEQETDGAQWTLESGDRTLRELVLAGEEPDMAVCWAKTARPWAQEGLLLPLQTHIPDQKQMQRQALNLCIYSEEMFMAPLIARHRQMAVNRAAFERIGLSDMLNGQTYPVWYPAQFYRILEEFMIRGRHGVDVWQAEESSSAAIETLVQALGGRDLLDHDGYSCHAGDDAAVFGVQWIADAVRDEMIGWQRTREEALSRFLRGETAIFIDWMQETEERCRQTIREKGLDIVTVPYPSALGRPVRSFELTGVCAFASGDAVRDAQLQHVCARLYASAQDVLGPMGIWQDGARWPESLEESGAGTTLRSLLCEAFNAAVETGEAKRALLGVQAVMDALFSAQ